MIPALHLNQRSIQTCSIGLSGVAGTGTSVELGIIVCSSNKLAMRLTKVRDGKISHEMLMTLFRQGIWFSGGRRNMKSQIVLL